MKVLVSGGTSGIGLATAQLLQQSGADVTVTGRDQNKIKHVKSENPGLNVVALDHSDTEALKNFFANFGKFDHLVLSLSSSKGAGPFATLSLEDLRSGFDGKFWPQLQTIQAALPYLEKSGSITMITASSSTARLPGTSGLAAINGALEIMTPILAKELQPLRVNAVSPGVVNTPWWNFLSEEDKRKSFEQYSTFIGVGRVGEATEIANAIVGIVNNGYINGSVLYCHGGLA
jgi:NAD(P)-dependent dehydrogenase (short-subunit alcohol dehydrogenase family)